MSISLMAPKSAISHVTISRLRALPAWTWSSVGFACFNHLRIWMRQTRLRFPARRRRNKSPRTAPVFSPKIGRPARRRQEPQPSQRMGGCGCPTARASLRGLLARSFRRRLPWGERVGEAVAAIEGNEVVHRQAQRTAHDGERDERVGVAEEQALGCEADALAVVGEQRREQRAVRGSGSVW